MGDGRCTFFLPKKNRFCANSSLKGSQSLSLSLSDYFLRSSLSLLLVDFLCSDFAEITTLRPKIAVSLARLILLIEDLNLEAVESLSRGPYLAVGKHLCGPATDLTLRCCLREHHNKKAVQSQSKCKLRGLALATCCHHLCQWKSYINKRFLINIGVTKEDFHAITWFTSWAVDADHGSTLTDVIDGGLHLPNIDDAGLGGTDVESLVKNMEDLDRAMLGLICKEIIDIGRYKWLQDHGLEAKLVKYVSSDISPENHLLMGKCKNHV